MTQTGDSLMAQAPRHAAPRPPRRSLLRAGLTVAAVGAALAAGAGAAQAAPDAALPAGVGQPADGTEAAPTAGQALVGALTHSAAGGLGPAKNVQLDPLAGTSADPLNNTIGTQLADFRPVHTGLVTAPLANGGATKDLPVAGRALGLLPG
ncbi:hypothetical protein [Streptomyces candidus]|uniref:Secreted protein n=1 Tax=Streptomyces candidus TaxID=67283 RepID=A0A7X0LNP5_9ACTN|nr:hypothetical protein [Streptomyces candidus]MBB6435087.1 hypothetical protein [Streptomyces candidus]GHH40864.1 hypothetical protein GCM10018773_22780 [Streptomyces candidus]